jgi:hypothetical protein
MDMKKYPYELFAELYHLRWPVEEDYEALKYRLQRMFLGRKRTII